MLSARRNVFRAVATLVLLVAFPGLGSAQVRVATQHNDNARSGLNLQETTLTTSNVNQNTFGKLFTRAVDDQVYVQPLYMPGLAIPSLGTRNVLFVATVNNSVYAFDADNPGAATPIWKRNFNDLANGVRPPNHTELGQNCGSYNDFSGNMGIVGTPVIDPVAGTLFVVVRTVESGNFVQRLRALSLVTGLDKANSPVVISASVPGIGAGSTGTMVPFNPKTQNQRPALLLANSTLYIAWASQCDTGPYHGWVMGYNPTTLAQTFAFCDTPNGSAGGIWQSGQGITADAAGTLFFSTGNGSVSSPTGGIDYGNAVIRMTASGSVSDWFIPFNYGSLNSGDVDLGSAGVLLIPNTNLLATGGKEGKMYILDRSNLGHYHAGSDTQIVQSFQVSSGGHIHGSPIYWDSPTSGGLLYVWCESEQGKAYQYNTSTGRFGATPLFITPVSAPQGMPGSMLSISSNGSTAGSGILWAAHQASGDANQQVRPGILRAFNADNITQELWNSLQNPARDDYGNFAKFSYPTIVNGRVYLSTFSNQVMCYGLLPAGDARPTVNAGSTQTIVMPDSVTLAGSASDDGLPSPPGQLTTTWVQVNGPGTATFGNPNALNTTATFSAPGQYILRLTASDGAIAADSDVTINVLGAGAIVGHGTGIKGQYWNNIDFTGTTVTRTDANIAFDWGTGVPAPGIAADTFSVRWTGQVQAQFSELYTFTTRSDDGVRLWVNNQLIIDNWTDHGPTDDTGTISLVKGQVYDIKMEYYDRNGGAVAQLSWASASTPMSFVPQLQLYPQSAPQTGDDTVGVYVPSSAAWFLTNTNAGGPASVTFAYGPANAGFVALSGDWDGNGTSTPGVYDPATGAFFLKNSNASGPADIVFTFGAGGQGYIPVAGDWDGNGTDTIGLYVPSTGAFFLRNSNSSGAADLTFTFGAAGAGWSPLIGDWDGDGRDTVGLYVPSTGSFFLRNSNTNGAAEWVIQFGPASAIGVAGDWNNDGISSIGIYVPSTGTWFLRNTNSPGAGDLAFQYGPANVTPLVGNWNGQ